MINNRQAGRRRGRNNPRQGGGGNRGSGDSGNRIDSRARGNAAQLLEKYRNMARDAQLAGDRVNAEYYLQFADHYFRVLADNRARQEEQQARFRRSDDADGDGMDGNDDGDDSGSDGDDAGETGEDEGRTSGGRDRQRGRERGGERGGRDNRREPRERRPQVANDEDEDEGTLNLSALPPAIGRGEANEAGDDDGEEAAEAAPKPRRGRRPRQAEAAE